ncbi:MAG: preprotein translocase subunit SecE [Clostridia bacterium]|nr:preprotein translocase subunit SecE [Clostridia bacterium]
MPDKKLVKASNKKPAFFSRLGGGLKRVFFLSFKNMISELRKVSWPNRKDLTNYTIVVVSFMVLMAVLIGLLDLGTSALLRTIISGG